MSIVRRTQPRTLALKPSYQLGSPAAHLAAQGLKPAQVDRAHPAPLVPLRGASHSGGSAHALSATHRAASRIAATAKDVLQRTGRAPASLTGSHTGALGGGQTSGGGSGHGGTGGGTGGGGHH